MDASAGIAFAVDLSLKEDHCCVLVLPRAHREVHLPTRAIKILAWAPVLLDRNRWVQPAIRFLRDRDAVGARVTVVAGDLTLIDEVHAGRGYQSHHGSRLYFGLGNRTQIDRVEVRWIGGDAETFEDIKVDQLVTLVEGASR